MTKKERIKQLEDKIAELEQRIVLLEAQPYTWWYVSPRWQWPTSPIAPNKMDDEILGVPSTDEWWRCTCGTTAVCPFHGLTLISGNQGWD